MMMQDPASARAHVSVCLASYNGERFIEDQLTSVLAQLQDGDEVIVSDDASQDRTVELVEAMADPRVRLLRNDASVGVVKNFERALRIARHDYIFLCDQDDVWLPGKVQRMADALQQAVMVVSDCRVVDENLQTLHPSFFALRGSRPGILHNLWRNAYLGCCIAMRASVLQRALPLPAVIPMHDMWLGLVAQTLGEVRFLPEVLSMYRRHGHAASEGAGVSSSSRGQQLRWRWQLASALLLRWSTGR